MGREISTAILLRSNGSTNIRLAFDAATLGHGENTADFKTHNTFGGGGGGGCSNPPVNSKRAAND